MASGSYMNMFPYGPYRPPIARIPPGVPNYVHGVSHIRADLRSVDDVASRNKRYRRVPGVPCGNPAFRTVVAASLLLVVGAAVAIPTSLILTNTIKIGNTDVTTKTTTRTTTTTMTTTTATTTTTTSTTTSKLPQRQQHHPPLLPAAVPVRQQPHHPPPLRAVPQQPAQLRLPLKQLAALQPLVQVLLVPQPAQHERPPQLQQQQHHRPVQLLLVVLQPQPVLQPEQQPPPLHQQLLLLPQVLPPPLHKQQPPLRQRQQPGPLQLPQVPLPPPLVQHQLLLVPTTSTTTTTPPPTYMYWPFDSNFNDFYNVYNGIGVNSPGFVTPGYNGYGAALSINGASAQYVLVPLYKNMTYASFTWEMWGYPTSLANYDCLMVGMCQTPVFSRCMYLMIRLNSTYFAFYGNDCWSTTIIPINQWHHFGFVYDYNIQTQYIYLNGILTCTQSSAGPFLASSGAITIGAINNTGSTPFHFWTGYLDEVQYVSRVKTPTEILDDATLVAYYSFDNGSFYDLGPNRINGTWINVTSVAGRVNQGILLNGNGQAFRASGFTLLGVSYRSYSISMWIYRSSPATGNGTLIHVSPSPTGFGAWCLPILGLSATYQVIAQNWNSSWHVAVTGPVIPLATWTHLVTSYSATNGIRLWVNGTLIGSSGPFPYTPSGSPNSIIAGSSLGSIGFCATGNIAHGQFYGRLDELRVYARELNAADVLALANP